MSHHCVGFLCLLTMSHVHDDHFAGNEVLGTLPDKYKYTNGHNRTAYY